MITYETPLELPNNWEKILLGGKEVVLRLQWPCKPGKF